MMRLWTILLVLFAVEAPAQSIRFQEQYPGVWKGTFGKPDTYTLLGAAGAKPRAATLEQLQSVDFPLPKMDVHAELIDGKTYLRFPLEKNEQIYGLGLNFQTVHQRARFLTCMSTIMVVKIMGALMRRCHSMFPPEDTAY